MSAPEVTAPEAVVEAFFAAARSGEAAAGERLASVAGWLAGGQSAGSLFRQVARKGLDARVAGAADVRVDRAAVPVEVGGGRLAVLLARFGAEDWAVEGVAREPAHADLYLRGLLPAVLDWAELPAVPGAEAAARRALEAAARSWKPDDPDASAEAVAGLPVALRARAAHLHEEGRPIEVIGSRGLPALGRAVVEARGGEGETWWLYLHRPDARAGWQPYDAAATRSWGRLLAWSAAGEGADG